MKKNYLYIIWAMMSFMLVGAFCNKRDNDTAEVQKQLDEYVSSLPNYADSIRQYDAKNSDDIYHLQNLVDFLNVNPIQNVNTDSLRRELLTRRVARQKLVNAQENIGKQKQQYLDSVRHANRFNLYVRNSSLQYSK